MIHTVVGAPACVLRAIIQITGQGRNEKAYIIPGQGAFGERM